MYTTPMAPLLRSLFLLLAMLFPSLLQAAMTLPATPETDIRQQLDILEDPDGRLTLDDVRSRQDWIPNENKVFNRGYNRSAWWLRVTVENPLTQPQQRLLALSYPVLRDVQYHVLGTQSAPQAYHMGADHPFADRPVDHRHFVIPLHWQAGEQLQIYVRVQSSTSVQAPLTLWQEAAFHSNNTKASVLHGLYFGGLLGIALFNLLLFFSLREQSYLYYVTVVIAMIILIASLSGYAYQYLWPMATRWNEQGILVSLAAVVCAACAFTDRFLSLHSVSRPLHHLATVLMVASASCLAAAFLLPYFTVITLLLPLVVVGCLYGMTCGIVAWRRHQEQARYYVLAWSFLLTGTLVLALSKAGMLPSNMLTDYAGHIGSSVEALLLSFALAQRINTERALRFQAQSETLALTMRHNTELEQRVEARTAELATLNAQLNELSITDALTGLRNRRYLDQMLKQEIERARRTGQPLAAILLDIDHFKKINDHHGHQVGDKALQHVGEIIRSCVRWPADIAARYGGEEFALILPNTDSQGAFHLAERIRSRVAQEAIQIGDQALSLTLSAGIHSAQTTAQPDAVTITPEVLLNGADTALYDAKHQGRNRTCLCQEVIAPDQIQAHASPETGTASSVHD